MAEQNETSSWANKNVLAAIFQFLLASFEYTLTLRLE